MTFIQGAINKVLIIGLGTIALTFSSARAEQPISSLSLNVYLENLRVDPLYAWPGVDLLQMEHAIEALKQSRTEIVEVTATQYDVLKTARVARVLYPTDFLEEMRALEETRRTALRLQDAGAVARYQAQLERTITGHLTYLDVLIPALENTAAEQSYKGLEYHFGRSSFEHFLSGIHGYRQDAEMALERVGQWQRCLDDVTDCPDVQPPLFPASEVSRAVDDFTQSDAAKIVYGLRSQADFGGAAASPGWAVLRSHQCFAAQENVPFLMWRFPMASGGQMFRADVVEDVQVHDHGIDESSNDYERKLDALGGAGYLYQSYTNLYACPDAAGDAAKLRAMVYAHQRLQSFNWSQMTSSEPKVQMQIDQIEADLQVVRNAQILDEGVLQAVMHELGQLLYMGSSEQLQATLGQGAFADLQEVYLAYRLQTPSLSQSIMNLIYGNTAIADYAPYAPWGYYEELLFTRNAPELLLGGNNPSVVSQDFEQVEWHREGTSPRLKSYRHELANIYSVQEMTSLLIRGANAELRFGKLLDRSYLFAD